MPSKFNLLAVPFSFILVSFIAYPSQWLFYQIEPGPLTAREALIFNIGTLCVFISYTRCVLVDAGITSHPKKENGVASHPNKVTQRWCKKCNAYKPPRAHHCKVCERCVLKMDHHCPWTTNCVGHRTLPHFARFLTHGTLTMLYLFRLFAARAYAIWRARNDAYVSASFCCRYQYLTQAHKYLGPTKAQLLLFLAELLVTGVTLLMIGMLCARTLYCLAVNVTSVESWEIERHEALLKRARKHGGVLNGPGERRIILKRHEFPYDVGVYRNIALGMGSYNPLQWLNPLAPSPPHSSGLHFEENGFLDDSLSWPPPDPDKMPAQRQANGAIYGNSSNGGAGFLFADEAAEGDAYVVAFKRRQQEDLRRRRTFAGPAANCGGLPGEEDEEEEVQAVEGKGEAWRNEDGETLGDYGVDEGESEEDVPLSQLMARRREKVGAGVDS